MTRNSSEVGLDACQTHAQHADEQHNDPSAIQQRGSDLIFRSLDHQGLRDHNEDRYSERDAATDVAPRTSLPPALRALRASARSRRGLVALAAFQRSVSSGPEWNMLCRCALS